MENNEIDISFGTIHIVLTTYCNMGCKGCYQTEKEILNKSEDFQLEFHKKNIKDLFKNFLNKNKKIELSFFGGEPLLKTNTMKEILLWLKKENLIPDKIKIPTSGGKNLTLIDSGLEVIYLAYELFPEIEISLSLSYDGVINNETRNIPSYKIKETITKLQGIQEKINKVFLSKETTNLIPEIIYEDYFLEQYNDIIEVTNKLPNFRLPHLMSNSNLDTKFFQTELRKFLNQLPKDIKQHPKLIRDIEERILQDNRDISYTWCNAGVNHFALTNIKTKEFSGCEFLDEDATTLYNKMMEHCNNCSIKYYCPKPCLKNLENNVLIRFQRHCTIRKILVSEIRDYLKENLHNIIKIKLN